MPEQGLVIQLVATVVKIVSLFIFCAQIPPIMVWVERRTGALIQKRKGPNRVGFFHFRLAGLLQSAADAVKLIFKEEVVPAGVNRVFFQLAPVLSFFPALLVMGAIPFGPPIEVMGQTIELSVIRLDVGFLFILAMSSLAVYGVALAGWAANNKYSLLGGLRASAQMISYEIPLGMSLIPPVIIFGTLDLHDISMAQGSNPLHWGVFVSPISFLVFLICMFAETNRAPFDLAESESELVAGFHTEYGSAKFAAIFFAEYVAMFMLSCLASIIFFGGWYLPFVPHDWLYATVGQIGVSLISFLTLTLKASFFMFLYTWVRWTLPRFRYDQLMAVGWKFMMPLALANIAATAVIAQLVLGN